MKNTLPHLLAFASFLPFSGIASAQDKPTPDAAAPRGEWRARMLKEFDKDNDGKLSDDERKAAREAGEKRTLERFDADKDGKLSDGERAKMREDGQKVREARQAAREAREKAGSKAGAEAKSSATAQGSAKAESAVGSSAQ